MLLLDTSVIVSALTREASSFRIADWIAANRSGLFITAWVEPEFSAALAMKRRTGAMSSASRLETLRLFDDMQSDVLAVIDVERADFTAAARLCDDVDLALRAPDALHVAVAQRIGAELVTLDVRMTRAARLVGLAVVNP